MSIAQSKIWQIRPKINRDFIKKFPEYDQVVLQLLYNRGLKEKDEIEQFLNPDFEKNLYDPFLFKDMEAAVELIIKHIKKQDKIVVYGDYDADGVTAAVLVYQVLTTLKGQVDVFIPDRTSEGYGLNKNSIDYIKSKDTELIITVDNGIRNKKEIDYIKNLGLDIIITDHHAPPENKEELPDCLIINPQLKKEAYPYKNLAGVGVAAKLAQALISKSKLDNFIKLNLFEKILDLIAIGTVTDCVSLLGENRILVKEGLKIINKQQRLGIAELINIAQINNTINSWHLGWLIGPRLNAVGRLEHANTAFELLVTENKEEAKAIARRLNDKNIERQKITDEMVKQIEEQIKKEKESKIIIAISPSIKGKVKAWNEGVVGLAASRICEKYYLPTIVITESGKEVKGSGRSIEEFNIIQAIEQSSEFLEKFGGHAGACGFSLKSKKDLTGFVKKIKELATKKLSGIDLKPKLDIEVELNLAKISEELVINISQLAPFGENNPRPMFLSKEVMIIDIFNMGINGQHIKLRLKQNDSSIISALGFGKAGEWQDLQIGDKIDTVYYVEINEFNGHREVQLKIVDLKKCD